MLISVIAATTIGFGTAPPVDLPPEDLPSKGYALVFTGRAQDGFEVFFKAPGKSWLQVPDAQEAAKTMPENPWLVFHISRQNVDCSVQVSPETEPMAAAGHASCDLDGYFEEDELGAVEANNFGLHDIY
ncbi:MAG: hypothetical protein H0W86_04050 [Armatimonadetes bacterium]|nr:hypothetical protein [Armatimonadota bacterium]